MRRRPRTLPGTDALLAGNVFLFLYPLSAVAVLAFSMAWVAYNNARFGYSGYLPWPIAQWVLTTPLGTFTVELIAGLISGLPFGVAAPWARSQFSHAVDVTELPPTAWPARPLPLWPARPLPLWRRPGGPTRADYWLGCGWRQRVLSLFALAVLLVLGFFAAYAAVVRYGLAHFPGCTPRCAPTFVGVISPTMFAGFAIVLLSRYGWIRHVERRCGIWFRAPIGTMGGFTCYVRRSGVTADAAAAALARYTRGGAGRPVARRILMAVLFATPFFLVQIALILLVT